MDFLTYDRSTTQRVWCSPSGALPGDQPAPSPLLHKGAAHANPTLRELILLQSSGIVQQRSPVQEKPGAAPQWTGHTQTLITQSVGHRETAAWTLTEMTPRRSWSLEGSCRPQLPGALNAPITRGATAARAEPAAAGTNQTAPGQPFLRTGQSRRRSVGDSGGPSAPWRAGATHRGPVEARGRSLSLRSPLLRTPPRVNMRTVLCPL